MPPQKRFIPRTRRRSKVTFAGTTAFTVDLSPGGFQAEMLRVSAPGTEASGVLSIDGVEYPFTGTVRWAKAGEARTQIRGRIGVQFTGIDAGYYKLFK